MTRPPLVNRVVLEPMMKRRDDGDQIADRLSRFARERLPTLLHDALRGFSEDATERILERLEIDLGDAPPDRLEKVLEERLAKVLRDRLIDRFGFPAGAAGSTARPWEPASDLGGRDAYPASPASKRGRAGPSIRTQWLDNADLAALADWLEGRAMLDARAVNRLFADALAVSAHDVALLLRDHGRREARRERLVATLDPSIRARAVHALRPTDARQVIGDVDRFSDHHRAAPVIAMSQQAFDAVLWQTVFAYLLADRGSRFNRRAFLGSLLTRLAAHAGVRYTDLLDGLLARVEDGHYAVERDESLRDVLAALRRQTDPGRAVKNAAGGSASEVHPASGSGEAGGGADGATSLDSADEAAPVPAGAAENRDLEALDFYMEQGAWPWFTADATAPAALVLRLAKRVPLRLVMVLRRRDSEMGREARLMRLAASLDARQRDQLIDAFEPMARRAMVGSLNALEALIEHAGFSAAQRRSLLRGLNAATLECISAARSEAFDERAWLGQILARAAQAAGLDKRVFDDVLLLVTHGDLARKRRIRWMRARLVEAGVGGEVNRSGDARVAGRSAHTALATSPESSSNHETPTGHEADRFVRALLLAWPMLVHALRLPRRALQAVPELTHVTTSDMLLDALNRLAGLYGIPLRRWFAGLAIAREWRQVDLGLKLLRSWRAHSGERSSTSAEISHAPLFSEHSSTLLQAAAAGASFLQFVAIGTVPPKALSWLSGSSDAWLDAVLRDDFAVVADALRARSPDEHMLRRLVRHFRADSLQRLAAALAPNMSALSLGLLRAGRSCAATARHGPEFAALQHAQLAALLAPAAARTSERVYIDRVLDGLARRLNLEPERLADELADAAADDSPVLRDLLRARSFSIPDDHDAARQTPRSGVQLNRTQTRSAGLARERPSHAQAWQQFALFMRYGEQSREPGVSIEAAIAQLARAAPQLLARALRENATVEPMHTRLASLDPSAFARLARAGAPRRASALLALQSVVAGFATRDAALMISRAQAAWLLHARRGSVRAMLAVLVEETLHRAGRAAHTVIARWRRAVRLAGVEPGLEREWQAWLAAREALVDRGGAVAPRVEIAPSDEGAAPERPRQSVKHESHPIYVANAGMVLLWPYLQRYYELLGLIREGTFIDFDSRSRAVYLLHWLASGHNARHEAELPLAKVMCGIVPSTPLAAAAEGEPDAREQAVSDELLGGVRQNWDKLRNTTTEGLRESFLMRNGRLMRDESAGHHWALIVETKAYDVLLDTLPWRISMIRLSWMTDMLAVQWRR